MNGVNVIEPKMSVQTKGSEKWKVSVRSFPEAKKAHQHFLDNGMDCGEINCIVNGYSFHVKSKKYRQRSKDDHRNLRLKP